MSRESVRTGLEVAEGLKKQNNTEQVGYRKQNQRSVLCGLGVWWVATAWFVSAPSDVCTIAKSFDAFPPSASLSLSDV